jgi:1-deoxy-D-xylulose-5-phosphate synthase
MSVVSPLLDQSNSPADLRGRSREELKLVADEPRRETINAVSVAGGPIVRAVETSLAETA